MLGTHLFFFWSVRARIAKGDPDFTVFYTAGRVVREGLGTKLYDSRTQQAVQLEFASNSDIRRGPLPYIHPPIEALLFLPLTFLPYQIAFWAWNLINLGILSAVAWLLRSWLPAFHPVPTWLLILFLLAFFPVFANFHQGQDAILLLFLVLSCFRAVSRGNTFAAGCWLGLGVFKYHLVLPLLLFLAVWKGKKLVAGFAVVSAVAVLISVGIVGWQGLLGYPAYAWRVVSQPAYGGIPLRQLPNLLGLLGGWSLSQKGGWLVQLAVLACSAGLAVVVVRLPYLPNHRWELCQSAAVIAAVLLGYSTNSYDLSLLVLPIAWVADYCRQDLSANPAARKWLIVPALPLLVSPLWFFLWMRWERLNLMAIFLVWWVFALRKEVIREGEVGPGPRSEAGIA